MAEKNQLRKSNEVFTFNGEAIQGFNFGTFLELAYSDLTNPLIRGRLAEFIVARALNLPMEAQQFMDKYDILYRATRIEIKYSAFITPKNTDYGVEKLQSPKFDICPHLAWSDKRSWELSAYERHSDIYIFCLLNEKSLQKLNPLQLEQWTFFVAKTYDINNVCDRRVEMPNIKNYNFTDIEKHIVNGEPQTDQYGNYVLNEGKITGNGKKYTISIQSGNSIVKRIFGTSISLSTLNKINATQCDYAYLKTAVDEQINQIKNEMI